MNKKENPRYETVRLRVTPEIKKGMIEFAESMGGSTISDAMIYFITAGSLALMKDENIPNDYKKASKRFWKNYWDPSGLIPKEIVDNL